MRVGAIDVGTNSVRVLVADTDPLRDVIRELTITRLGEGVDAARVLAAEPLRRTVAAIAGYVERCREAGCERIRVTATSAVRDAANRSEFLDAVERATGLVPDVLPGDEEARLGFLGATMEIASPPPYLVVDIGGGSTEVVRGERGPERFVSLDIGSVRLTERHLSGDPPSGGELDALRADARSHVARARDVVGRETAGTLVGLAGTITTVAAIALGLAGYDRDAIHHAVVSRTEVAAIRARLAAMTSEQRRALPAMPRGREDVIVGGVVILEEVMDAFDHGEVLVSETDILDGTAMDLAARDG